MNSSEASFSQDNTMWTSLDRIFAINEPPVYHLLTCNPYTLRQTVKKCLEKRKHKHRSHLSKTVNKQHTDVTMERRPDLLQTSQFFSSHHWQFRETQYGHLSSFVPAHFKFFDPTNFAFSDLFIMAAILDFGCYNIGREYGL